MMFAAAGPSKFVVLAQSLPYECHLMDLFNQSYTEAEASDRSTMNESRETGKYDVMTSRGAFRKCMSNSGASSH